MFHVEHGKLDQIKPNPSKSKKLCKEKVYLDEPWYLHIERSTVTFDDLNLSDARFFTNALYFFIYVFHMSETWIKDRKNGCRYYMEYLAGEIGKIFPSSGIFQLHEMTNTRI